jgi:type VI secretion system secreted protein VgrG
MQRIYTLGSPLGDGLVFRKLTGQESLSELYEWHVEVQSASPSIALETLLGKPASIRIETDSAPRYLQGIVTQAYMAGSAEDEGYLYKLIVRPWLWLATKVIDHRIWQFKTVPQIIQETLQPFGYQIENRLTENYRTWTYCVQYQESAFNFVSRLMEHEGIYYYFEHDDKTHKLILCDGVRAHKTFAGYEDIQFLSKKVVGASAKEHVHRWQPGMLINSGSVEMRDFDFEQPHLQLNGLRQNPQGHTYDGFQQYHWPGGFTNDEVDGRRYASIRLEAEQSDHATHNGQASIRGMVPGCVFTLRGFPQAAQNREYLVKSCIYHFQESHYHSGTLPVIHDVKFAVLASDIPFRSRLVTHKPRIFGPQTAIVAGPQGEEIYCDQYGRVKLHFLWDRHGSRDENASCWVRVSNPWASSNFGGIQVPRIDDEVIVEHLDGDPDYPIITGRVYNASKMPPWDLPQNATQMGLLTRSSPGGNPTTANALRFEDRMGQEEVWLHAEKDQRIEVENDESHWVGNDRKKDIDGNETITVKKNRTTTVFMNDTTTVGMNRTATVGMNESTTVVGNYTLSVGQNMTSTVTSNWKSQVQQNHNHTVGQKLEITAKKEIKAESNGTATYAAKDKLTIQCGQASITLESNGDIKINGTSIGMKGSSSVDVHGGRVHIN